MPAVTKMRKFASDAASAYISSQKIARQHLRQLHARANRLRCNARIVAVTGSSAKTTTVSLLSHILSGNSQVLTQVFDNGLRDAAKTLRRMKSDDDYVIMEAGTGAIGHIQPIAQLMQPDIAIVTLVALEHYSAFRTLEAVARRNQSWCAHSLNRVWRY